VSSRTRFSGSYTLIPGENKRFSVYFGVLSGEISGFPAFNCWGAVRARSLIGRPDVDGLVGLGGRRPAPTVVDSVVPVSRRWSRSRSRLRCRRSGRRSRCRRGGSVAALLYRVVGGCRVVLWR